MYLQSESVYVFGQVSDLYRTGKPIKRVDTASTDKQADRFVKQNVCEKLKSNSGNHL